MKNWLFRIVIAVIVFAGVVGLFRWATPIETPIAEGFYLLHFREGGGKTYVVNEGGIKLVGPKIVKLEVDENTISGFTGQDGDEPFLIDRATGMVAQHSF